MRTFSILLACLSLFAAGLISNSSAEFADVTDWVQIGGELFAKIFHTWEVVSPEDQDGPGEYLGPELPGVRRRERKLLSRMKEVSQLVNRVERAVFASSEATVRALMTNLPDVVRLELRLDRLTELMTGVGDRNAELSDYIKDGYDNTTELLGTTPGKSAFQVEAHTLLDFANHAVAHDESSVRGLMSRINSLVAPASGPFRSRSIFVMLNDALKDQGAGVLCGTQQSPQQLLLNLFNSIQLVQLQGYAVMQFSWMILRLYDKGNFSVEAKIYERQFKRHQETQVAVVRGVLKTASRAAWRCDPSDHKEGTTYEQVTRLLQGFLVNEVDLNGEQSCKENCAFYNYAEPYGCFKDLYCAQQPWCFGRLHNCQYFDSDLWVCPSTNITRRRYDYLEFENGQVLGEKKQCERGTSKVDSWWRYLMWHCSYCVCLCDEDGPLSDRYFSLRPVLSDISSNKVVTGLRIVKKNRIFHFQIEQGEVTPKGLNKSELDWKSVDGFSLYGKDVREGQDYFKLDWQQRAIDLDDLMAPAGHVLTGVAFRNIGGHLNLIMRATPIDIRTGRLQPKGSIWVDNSNTPNSGTPRTELVLDKPDVSTKTIASSRPDSKPDMFIRFTNTDLGRDAAQTTVPFIDIQYLAPDPPVLLSGVGIFHKGQPHYGGFIAPKVFTYDYSHVIAPISPSDDVEGNAANEYFVEQNVN
ncbi:Mycobactin import ATP-binding/permease protein IrtB [Frankliniella fusca]|uniref:Mycobactin import ATP-binding/permease protein IrtB n=1 Tax=Frankliniella fusca TaxID=407009 RepID=A0AAE1GUS9_9NEOP|nr:Mycobactin import ATP-binding/permease protein IrtB [Frankliniella fusca]